MLEHSVQACMCLLMCFFSPLVSLARPNLSGPVLKARFVSLHRTRSHYKRKPSWLWALSGAGLTISLPLEMWTSTQRENMTLIFLPLSGCCHGAQVIQPGGLCSLVATLVASAASSRAEMTIPAGWLRKWQSPLEHVGSLLCSLLSSGGGEYLDEMASIRRISTDICAYLPFGHDWTKTSTQGREDFLWEAASAWFWCRCVDSTSFHVS